MLLNLKKNKKFQQIKGKFSFCLRYFLNKKKKFKAPCYFLVMF